MGRIVMWNGVYFSIGYWLRNPNLVFYEPCLST